MKKHRLVKQFLIAGFGLAFWTGSLSAAAPLAGTAIGNQAKATYTDSSAQTREVFSNTVTTTVTQVAGLTLVETQSKNATPGSQVFFPHTLTNTGNGPDTFDLSAVTSSANLGGVIIYPDADQNGLPDNYVGILTTGQIAPGGTFHFVVSALVQGSATVPSSNEIDVTATSTHNAAVNATNKDTVNVINGAVMQVTKAIDTNSGTPGTTGIRYTITYTNTGNAAATGFYIKDVLPEHMTYVDNSSRWSITGTGSELTDDNTFTSHGSGLNTLHYRKTTAGGRDTIEAVIANVNAGQSGFITFMVDVAEYTDSPANTVRLAPQILANTAGFDIGVDPLNLPGSLPAIPDFNTNTVPFQVLQVAGVTLGDDTVASASAGGTVVFENELINTGTGVDTFDITLISHNFPNGTTFQFFQQDRQTPMVDSTGNGVPDTGPLDPNEGYTVVVKAYLPSFASGGPYALTKRATSTFNNTVWDNGVDTLTLITGAGVDLTNNIAAVGDSSAPGEGLGPEGTAVVRNDADPGTTTRFTLYVKNTGPNPDTFDLLAKGGNGDFTNITVNTLPAGWTVTFKNASGLAVSNTGVVQASASTLIYADVFVPAGHAPGEVSLFFQVKSPMSGAADVIHDAVGVNTVRKIEIATSAAAQTFPGGQVVYEHILTNVGNVLEGDGVDSNINLTLEDSLVDQAWSSIIYYDANGNGVVDATDPVVTDLSFVSDGAAGLAPGESVRLLVRVFAPLGAPDGATNITTITATIPAADVINGVTPPNAVSNEDVTTVVRGDLRVVKEQRIGGAGGWSLNPLAAPPGEVIEYRITVTNMGSTDATGITLYDSIPAYTTYTDTPAPVGTVGISGAPGTAPVNGYVGGLEFNIGILQPAQEAVVQFSVKINE